MTGAREMVFPRLWEPVKIHAFFMAFQSELMHFFGVREGVRWRRLFQYYQDALQAREISAQRLQQYTEDRLHLQEMLTALMQSTPAEVLDLYRASGSVTLSQAVSQVILFLSACSAPPKLVGVLIEGDRMM